MHSPCRLLPPRSLGYRLNAAVLVAELLLENANQRRLRRRYAAAQAAARSTSRKLKAA